MKKIFGIALLLMMFIGTALNAHAKLKDIDVIDRSVCGLYAEYAGRVYEEYGENYYEGYFEGYAHCIGVLYLD